MIDLGLTAPERAAYEATLRQSHDIRIRVIVLDRNEVPLAQLNPRVISGAVQIDTTQQITRSLSLVCLDPHNKLTFDSASPADGALYADNFVRILYGVYVGAPINDWVDCPVFTGPLTTFERIGAQVTIEAQGKECLGLSPHDTIAGYWIPKGTLVANAIRDVLDRIGETHYNLGMISGRLASHRSVAVGLSPWTVCVGGGTDRNGNPIPGLISKANGNKYLFYDGRGSVTAKERVAIAKWVFTGDDMVTEPDIKYDILNAINHVEVTGGTPKKSKQHYRASATLPGDNPLNPYNLARNGKPRFMTLFFASDALKSTKACFDKAASLLAGQEGVTASFDCLVIPHLEEFDQVAIRLNDVSVSWPLAQATIPLTADTAMSIGYNKSVFPRKPGTRSS